MNRFLPWACTPLLSAAAAAQDPLPEDWRVELDELRARVHELEQGGAAAGSVDLGGDELPALGTLADEVAAWPWWQRVTLTGYGAATYLDTGGVGTRRDGSFLFREASLFLDVQVWEETSIFVETYVTRFPYPSSYEFHTGEIYARFDDLCGGDDGRGLGLKAGRFDIPFGEEYTRRDANQNRLVTTGAANPYGLDEGVMAFGPLGPCDWVLAIMDGTSERDLDTDSRKTYALKVSGDVSDELYASASALTGTSHKMSALRLSGSYLQPVGDYGVSTAGTSPSNEVDTHLWVADAIWTAGPRSGLAASVGQGWIDDDVSAFDRELAWFTFEPRFALSDEVFATLRYSEIGTYDDDEGYRFDGKVVAAGESLGYDVSRLQRLSGGLGWDVNPNAVVKVEVGKDWFELIDVSPLQEENDERLFFAFEVVLSF